MSATTQQELDKLIVHWTGHYIVGNKSYQKGCRIYLTLNNQLVDNFKSNNEAYSVMVNHLTGKEPWWPGKKKEQECEFLNKKMLIQPDDLVLHSTAVKILNLRDEADRLMKTINIDPLLQDWRYQLMEIINK